MTAGTCGRIRTCIAGMAPIRGAAASEAEQGVISNWQNSAFDLRPRQSAAAKPCTQVVIISGETATVPPGLALLIHDCQRSVFQVRAHGAAAVPTATNDDFDELVGGIAAEANQEPHRLRHQYLIAALNAPNEAPRGGRASRVILTELDITRVQRWFVARVPNMRCVRSASNARSHWAPDDRRAPLPPASTPGSATGRSEVATASST
jgi:hypothetical protein